MLKGYHEALDRIVAADAMASADSREAYALLTRIAAETLNCERVSVWTARPDRDDIRCVDLYQLSKAAHAAGMTLAKDAFPAYFEAFRNAEIIDAADAVNDPRTRELADGYLAEHGITSLLDFAIHVGGELRGIFCLEHVGPARQWSLEEQSLARSLAALTSLIMARQEQQEAERGRQSVERRFSEIVNALPSALSLKDRSQRYVFVNKVYERVYGIRAEEAYGRTIGELGLNNPDILASIAAEDTAVLEQGRSFTGETIRIGRDEIERPALVSKFPVYDKDGNVDLVATLWTDISEQKAVQKTLEDARARLRAITDNVPIMLSLKDGDGVYRHCNAKFAEWHGIRPEQVIGKTLRDLLPDARAEEIGNIDREVLETGEVRVFETDTVFDHLKDGAPLTLRQFKFPIRDDAGAVTGIGTAMLDITDERRAETALQAHLEKLEEMVADRTMELTEEIAERRRAEAELLRTEANLRAILEKSPVGVAIVGREPRRRLFVNQSFLDMFGAKDEEALNAVPMADTYVDAADLERLGGEFDKTGAILAREVRRKRVDGTEWWALLDARSVEFEGERAAIVWHYDITDRKEAAEALARQAETLEQAVAERTRELRESESLLNSIFEHLPVGIFIKDVKQRLERANSTYARWYGVNADDHIGTTTILSEDLHDSEDIAVRWSHERDVLTKGETRTREVERRFVDGRLHTINVTKFPIFDDQGRVTRLGSVSIDVTQEVEARQRLEESERLLRAVVDNLPVGLAIKDADGRYLQINKTLAEWHGLAEDRLRGLTFEQALGDIVRDSERVREHERKIIGTGEVLSRETTRRFIDGRVHDLLITKYPVLDKKGKPHRVVSVIQDLTDLRDRERQLSTLVENVPGLVFRSIRRTDGSTHVEFLSEGVEEIIGQSAAEVMARMNAGDLGMFHPGAMAEYVAESNRCFSEGRPFELTYQMVANNGEIRWVLERSRTVEETADGWAVEGLVLDVTERKLADDALRESEARLQAITQNAPLMLNLKDRDGRYRFVNESYAAWVGKPVDAILGRTMEELFSAPGLKEAAEREAWVMANGEALDYESGPMMIREDKHTFHYIKFPVRDARGEVFGVGTAIMDVTDRKRADLALKDSEARFRGLFENAPAGITIKTPDGRYLAMNRTFLDWKGWDLVDVVGRRARDLFCDEVGDHGEREERDAIASRSTIMKEVVIKCADGRNLVTTNIKAPMVTPDGQITGVCSFFVDISEIREIEAQLQQAQKMEAIGRLAGGIAHDFNNLLGAMMGFNEFLIEDLPEGTPQHNFAQRVARAGERAKQLVSQILAFSRASHGEQSVIDLNAICDEAATLLSGTLPVTTRVVFHPSDAQVTALTNAGQMSQVLMNLGVNANDAFAGADEVIDIGVERIPAGSKLLHVHDGPVKTSPEDFMEIREMGDGAWQVVAGVIDPGADHVMMYVEDTGPGIAEPVLRRIFEPFFTTKEASKGTGLGLAVVHGIVTAHHGALRVRTRLGAGTRFEVFLPCAAPAPDLAAAAEVAETVAGRGMILVVDDERDVADMVSIGLERLGYEVGVCASGDEAIKVFGETPDLWRAVISDQIMPDMRGIDLIKRIKDIRADVPCVLCTGYSDTLTEETARAGGADAFFQKPVSASRLGHMLADLLDG